MAAMRVQDISEAADAAVKSAPAGNWDRMFSDVSTAASLHDDDSKVAADCGELDSARASDDNCLSDQSDAEGAPDDSPEADLAASVSVSIAIIVVSAAASAWMYPAAFGGVALLGLVTLTVVWYTQMPCGIPAAVSNQQQKASTGSQVAFDDSQLEGDCPPDDGREADLAASVSVSLAIIGLATALSPWLWPAAFVGLALLGLVALAVVVLTHMPCGVPVTPLRAELADMKTDLAGSGQHIEVGDCPPEDSNEADQAALVPVSCAIVMASILASSLGSVF